MARVQSNAISGHYECKTGELAATPQTEDQMESGLFLDVVIRKSAAILQLLACKDEPLLVGGNALLILDLGLHILMVSLGSTSRVMVLLVKVLVKICIYICE